MAVTDETKSASNDVATPSTPHSNTRVTSLSTISTTSSSATLTRQDSHLRKQHSRCKIVFCIFTTIVVAFLIPTQAGLNVLLAKELGSPLRSSFVSFCVGSMALSTFLFYDCKGNTIPTFKNFFNHLNSNKKEYYLLINGPLGVIYVTTVIYISPIIGFALYFMCVVAGQIILSTLIDIYQSRAIYSSSNNNNDNNNKNEKHRMYFLTFFSILIILAGVIMFQMDSLTNKQDFVTTIICSLIAFTVGIIDVIKSFINRRIKVYIGSPWISASTNFINGTFCIGIIALIQYLSNTKENTIEWNDIDSSKWYVWIGGLTGAVWMTIVTIIMPGYIGYVGAVICAIFGNFLASIIYDTFGIFGVKTTQLTWNRIVGSICVFIAVVLINVNKLLHSRNNRNDTNNNKLASQSELKQMKNNSNSEIIDDNTNNETANILVKI